jgi:transcriptional regulator GlxA family with amidase domain
MVAFPGVQMLDLSGPMQVFASANDALEKVGKAPLYVVSVVSRSGGSLPTSGGLSLASEPLPPLGGELDTLLVTGGPGVEKAISDAFLVDWIRARAANARRVVSVCTGALLLAASGALDGRRATTHWAFCPELARRFPTVVVETDPIFVRDDNVWTSAGVTAGIDLALALVEEDLGRDVALAVARYLVVFLKRPGGQAQFSTALSLQMADDRFGALHAWMGRHLAQDLSLAVLADHMAMSPRSFSRHYHEATGLTPARAVEQLRVEEARRLLLESDLPIKRIAQRCGFGSEETMRRNFARLLHTSPLEYRSRFGRPA